MASQPALQWVRTLTAARLACGDARDELRRRARRWRGGGDVLLGDGRGFAPAAAARLGAAAQPRGHPLERPAEIDRRRAGGGQAPRGLRQRGVRGVALSARPDLGRGRADQRRAAHLHVADGVGAGPPW